MSSAKAKNAKIPYEDLSGRIIGRTKVIKRKVPVREPEFLNDTTWVCECLSCGCERNISGRLLYYEVPKDCKCISDAKKIVAASKDEDTQIVGRGLIYAQKNEPEKFAEYLARRNMESLYSKGIPNNHRLEMME